LAIAPLAAVTLLGACGTSSAQNEIVFDASTVPAVTTTPSSPNVGDTTTAPGASTTSTTPPWTTADAWTNVTANLAGMASECGNLTMVTANAGDAVLAGVAGLGLWRLNPASGEWEQLGQGPGSDPISNRPSTVVFDPADPQVFWESGIYNGGGVFRTDDAGQTFRQLGEVTHVEAIGIDLTDPQRATMLVAIHEQAAISLSTDGGDTWDDISDALPAIELGDALAPVVLDANTFLLGTTTSVLRSTDQGASWTTVADVGVTGRPVTLADGSMLWLALNGVIRSTDGGATWTVISATPLRGTPVAAPDGAIAAASADGTQVWASTDGGASWDPVGPRLSFTTPSIAYSSAQSAFFAVHSDCGDVVLDDAVAALPATRA
jgi:hypothetical protein